MPKRYRAMVITQGGLGLRVGELLALRVDDIEWLRREVRITEQLQPKTRERVPPKTRLSRRTVPLPKVVSDALAEHIATYPPGEDGSIFVGETTGKPLARETYSRSIARAVRTAKLPQGTSSHSLRHHYASVLLDAGESVVTVAARLGDTAQMVLSVYGHMLPDTEDRTRRAVDAAWAQPSTPAVVTSV
jgi:integrase